MVENAKNVQKKYIIIQYKKNISILVEMKRILPLDLYKMQLNRYEELQILETMDSYNFLVLSSIQLSMQYQLKFLFYQGHI